MKPKTVKQWPSKKNGHFRLVPEPSSDGRTAAAARACVVVMHDLPPHNEAYIWEPQAPNLPMRKLYLNQYSSHNLKMWDFVYFIQLILKEFQHHLY